MNRAHMEGTGLGSVGFPFKTSDAGGGVRQPFHHVVPFNCRTLIDNPFFAEQGPDSYCGGLSIRGHHYCSCCLQMGGAPPLSKTWVFFFGGSRTQEAAVPSLETEPCQSGASPGTRSLVVLA